MLVETGVTGVPIAWRAKDSFARADRAPTEEGKSGMMAYIMLNVPGKNVAEVMDALRGMDGVAEASTVYGESDIIARVQVPSQDDLDSLVMDETHGIAAVESTRTYRIVGGMHLRRTEATSTPQDR